MLRQEYPRPELVREKWLNLNGEWEFNFIKKKGKKSRELFISGDYKRKIIVPFCPESKLSCVEHTDFIQACWYKRTLDIPADWNGKILLNFEAVYYYAEVYINGHMAGSHKGGYTPFSIDITKYLKDKENILTLYCEADPKDGLEPSGKQSNKRESHGCMYTRSTGIWQTVWLECVPEVYLNSVRLDSDIDNSTLTAKLLITGQGKKNINLTALYNGKIVAQKSAVTTHSSIIMQLDISDLYLWSIESPQLYDLIIEIDSESGKDKVDTYFGMRKIELDENCLKINGKKVFQRLVLDQGYYPDGIYTAPSEDDLKKDIVLSLNLGFNGARLHEKVFERRFLYYADKMGYIVWGEYPNWGFDYTRADALQYYYPEWMEAVERDYNHPSLIGWCPFNENWDVNGRRQNDDFIKQIYLETKRYDTTRPVIDTSGNYHTITDIYDTHDYCQDIGEFTEKYSLFKELTIPDDCYDIKSYVINFLKKKDNEKVYTGSGKVKISLAPDREGRDGRQAYQGEPYFVSEYGGIKWPNNSDGWGYGDAPKSIEEFKERYVAFANVLLSNPKICALCYTQLYDVEQEKNGIYYYDRSPKFDKDIMDALYKSMAQAAAIEKE